MHWVPAVNRYMVTSYEACHLIEQDAGDLLRQRDGSLMKRAMGHSMLRKDDPEHQRRPRLLRFRPAPEHHQETLERDLRAQHRTLPGRAQGQGSGRRTSSGITPPPMRRRTCGLIMGFHNATQEDMQRWSQTMIDGTGNYADDPEVWARPRSILRRGRRRHRRDAAPPAKNPDPSPALRAGLHADPLEAIRANLKMTIGGGLNEPRDVLAITAWALLTHPEQLDAVRADPKLCRAFEEAGPLGGPDRHVPARDHPRDRAGRRPACRRGEAGRRARLRQPRPAGLRGPESFNVLRAKKPHLAFGGGQPLLRRHLGGPRLVAQSRCPGPSRSCRTCAWNRPTRRRFRMGLPRHDQHAGPLGPTRPNATPPRRRRAGRREET